jgi:hypothetical protein
MSKFVESIQEVQGSRAWCERFGSLDFDPERHIHGSDCRRRNTGPTAAEKRSIQV